MLSIFFLHRPVFAWVIAIIFMAVGLLAIYRLPRLSQSHPLIRAHRLKQWKTA
jgi:multidrug efflux pump subunit AcrB